MKKTKLAIIGTNGVPAQYGGFETLVENLVECLSQQFDITVYCSKSQKSRIKEYKGARLRYIPLSANRAQGILYDALCLFITRKKYDQVLVLGIGSIVGMYLCRKYGYKYTLNIGGIDWRRDKWGRVAKWYIHTAEKGAIPVCSRIVSDNEGIRSYIKDTYGKDSYLIEYGGDQVTKEPITEVLLQKYSFLKRKYALVVARIQSDNNIEMSILGARKAGYPLVVVGNWNFTEYGIRLREKYQNCENLYLLDAIYDQKELNVLRSNTSMYIHGHSGGGTNPSLVEAMFLDVPILCFNNGYNNNTTESAAFYYKDAQELSELLKGLTYEQIEKEKKDMAEIAHRRYTWKRIAEEYARVINDCN